MHPQITGVLWQGVYAGRFDRTAPDGTPIKGLETKQAVIERIRDAAAKIPADGRWLVAWGYQPEFYGNSPLTRADLDPISNGHPIFIENLSMHIYYANSKAFEIAGITDDTGIVGIVKKDGKPTGEIEEVAAAFAFVAKLPSLDSKFLLKATRDAGELAHRVGVTTVADLSFGTIPGGYQAYQTAAADPDFPVRVVLNPLISIFQKGEIADRAGSITSPKCTNTIPTASASVVSSSSSMDRSRATRDCSSGPTTTRHSPMGSRTFRKRT